MQNSLQYAMSAMDEAESLAPPAVLPHIKKAKRHIHETSLLIESNTRPLPIETSEQLRNLAIKTTQGGRGEQTKILHSFGDTTAGIRQELKSLPDSVLKRWEKLIRRTLERARNL